jgi:sialic acid synthase SpsE
MNIKSEATKDATRAAAQEIKSVRIGNRQIGFNFKPLVIAEIGINHEGNFDLAVSMVKAAASQGCECVKFQCHIPAAEMLREEAEKIVPVNAKESIYDIIARCSFSELQERKLKKLAEDNGMLYLSTPFSREAVDRLERLKVKAYKIGSGECNNYPLVEYIARQNKPVILSTGMNDVKSTRIAVDLFNVNQVQYVLLHCTSLYPTPYNKTRLYAMKHLQYAFNCNVGLSDHTKDNYTSFGAVALGASVIERHFTTDRRLAGPDQEISMEPKDLCDLIDGTNAIFEARNGVKTALQEERVTVAFAYASVVVMKKVYAGEFFTADNLWVKRPGTGQIHAVHYRELIGRRASKDLQANTFLKWDDVVEEEVSAK